MPETTQPSRADKRLPENAASVPKQVLKKELKCHVVTNILWVTLPFLTARPNVQTLSENINALHVTTGVTWMLIAVLLRGSLTGHVAVSLAAGVR